MGHADLLRRNPMKAKAQAATWNGSDWDFLSTPDNRLKPRSNRNAVAASSPALPDEEGLRWVTKQNEINPERVGSIPGAPMMQPFQGWNS
jgi:hypothetical protein